MSQKLDFVPIDQITPYERNARIHDSPQIDQLASIIDLVGFINPVVVDKDNTNNCRSRTAAGCNKTRAKENPCYKG